MTPPGLTVRYLTLATTAREYSPTAVGFVVLEDESRFAIDRDCVIGRAPEKSNALPTGCRPVRIDGLTGGMSRVHLQIRQVDGHVFVVDLGSRNGVLLREPATHGWTRLTPWRPAVWRHGAAVRIGCRTLTFETG